MVRGVEFEIDDRRLREIIRQHPAEAQEWLDEVSETILTRIVLDFGTGPDGIRYGNHVASQPGYPPNVDTGTLKGSMTWRKVEPLHNRIEDGTDYGVGLELGTEKIRPRPFVSPQFRLYREREVANDIRENLYLKKLGIT